MSAFDTYQVATRRTAGDNPNRLERIVVLALGLAGESGEVTELIKKWVGHGMTFETRRLEAELGDLLWYLTRMADEHGISLQAVADANVAKLKVRYPDGFVNGGGVR